MRQRRATEALGGEAVLFAWVGMGVFAGAEGLTENVTVEKNLKELKDSIIQYLGEDHFRQEKKKKKINFKGLRAGRCLLGTRKELGMRSER